MTTVNPDIKLNKKKKKKIQNHRKWEAFARVKREA